VIGGAHNISSARPARIFSRPSRILPLTVPIGICSVLQAMRGLQPADIWLAIVLGHLTRAVLSVFRFRQGKWRSIAVDIEPARP